MDEFICWGSNGGGNLAMRHGIIYVFQLNGSSVSISDIY
jgi:hypothetical protein